MPDLSSSIAKHINYLLSTATADTSQSVLYELSQFAEFGIDGSILLLRPCLDHLEKLRADSKSMQADPLIVSLFKYLLDRANFATAICQLLSSQEVTEGFLEYISGAFWLSLPEKIALGLALSDSENNELKIYGNKFCTAQVEMLLDKGLSDYSSEQIEKVVSLVQRSESLCKHLDSFMQMLSLAQLEDVSSFVLAPLLSDECFEANYMGNRNLILEGKNGLDGIIADIDDDKSDGNIMKELGYGCAVSVPQCKEIFSTLFSSLNESTIAQILGAVACNQELFEDNQIIYPTFNVVLSCNNSSDLTVPSSWNVNVLVDSIKQLAPNTNWFKVVESLDYDGFCFPNEDAFSVFMNAYRIACQEPFPLDAICGSVWNNTKGQLSFLKYAVSAAPETFTFVHAPRKLAYVDAVHGHKLHSVDANHAWLCLDLLNVLCQLFERGHTDAVQSIIAYPLKHCPEVLLLGVSHSNTACNLLQLEISHAIFPMALKNVTGSDIVHYLWRVNPHFLLRGFADAHNADQDILVRILDICQELKILPSVLETIPFSSGIRLAALASRKELIDLERWLTSNLNTYKDIYFEECLKFLREVQSGGSQDPFHQSHAVLNAYLEIIPTLTKVLKAHIGLLTSIQLVEEMKRLHLSDIEPNTTLQNSGATESASDGFADDVEAEANSYFHQMFSGQLNIETMVEMLARLKESSLKREQSIFECMIANLYEEYKFFPKYPERQLKIAALLFGSIIRKQLVTHLTLGIALRRVLDALRKPPDSKMFVFGTKALEQFIDRLIEWPQYCNHILQISHLRGTQPELVAFIERALARISSGHPEPGGGNNIPSIQPYVTSQAASGIVELNDISGSQPEQQDSSIHLLQRIENSLDDHQKLSEAMPNDSKLLLPSTGQASSSPMDAANIQKNAAPALAVAHSSSPGFARPSRAATSTRFGSALNIETLVAAAERRDTPIEAPASEIQDKISFLINNISTANIDTKAKEFTEFLREQYYPWFAQYMVMKRASIEPNFHDLYLKFLDKINSRVLYKEIVQATYENCKVLLGSELIKSSSEERSLLKNLGSWLGKLTIGRNQVLRASYIDPKSLIIEAYEKGLMIAVIPFTSKILEPCQTSLAYRPPNPWTMGILSLLGEIYSMPGLKMNLKFDIEVLFKNLGEDLKEITPSCLLKDRIREVEANPDFSNKDVGAPQTQVVPEVKPAVMPPLSQIELPIDVASSSNAAGHTHLLSQYPSPMHLSSGTLMEDGKLATLALSDQLPSTRGLFHAYPSQSHISTNQVHVPAATIGTHVVINPKLSAFGLQMHFQRVVPVAMDRAVKEIVSNIVQRSVSIATQTTKELVLKDYASETDDNRTKNAARLMVASLAGSLAHVTCKEPLRSSISSLLRNALQGLNVATELLEQAVQLVTNDNLDLGCAVIEQAATEKAMHTIDGEISQQLAMRRKHREAVGPTFFDANMFGQGSIAIIPDVLLPKPGHLSHSQQRVYEDFVRLPWQNQAVQSSSDLPSGATILNDPYGSVGQLNPGFNMGLGNMGFDAGTQSIDVSEPVKATSSPLHRASSAHVGATEAVIQHGSENDSIAVPAHPSVPVESSNIVKDPGPLTQPLPSSVVAGVLEPSLTTGDALQKYQTIAQKLDSLVAGDLKETDIQGIVAEVPDIIFRCISRGEAALAVAQKVFKGLYENSSNNLHAQTHLAILAAIRDVCKLVVKELTSWVLYSEEERKYNKDITVGLIRSELLNLAEYNMHMAKLIDGGRNKSATEFAVSLLQTLVVEEPKVISELHNLIDALAKVAAKPGSPESLQQPVEIARNPSGSMAVLAEAAVAKEDKSRQSKDKKVPGLPLPSREDYNASEHMEPDPAGLREQVSMYFADWYRICEHPGANDAACTHYILQLHQKGLLKEDDLTDRFIRILTELSVSHCLSSEVINSGSMQPSQQSQTLSFLAIDIYAKLVYWILKGSNRPSLLTKIMAVTIRLIKKDAEEKKTSFNPRPYFRLFINWLSDLTSLEPATDGTNFQVLTAFANVFHALQPLKVPGFSFVWLELVSHRSFMPKLLTANAQNGWVFMQRLLVDLFQFLEPYLRNAELGTAVHLLYKGTLRVLLVMLHDFPEFLSDYHFTFCDVIPASCIQMRNIILSAYPSNMRLLDPSTPNLKIDLLPEISLPPRILSEVDAALKAKQMKDDVDEYLKDGKNSTFLTELKQKLLLCPSEAACAGTRYNVPLISSLVLYVGMEAIQQLQSKAQSTASTVPLAVFLVDGALDIFRSLMLELDTEGRYLYINAIANQLRYPNNHTHYFSFILLYLFAGSNQEIIQEQITRVLLERLIANRPHPWGLLVTVMELVKNPQYNFWNKSFIRCAPEIEKLFDSVLRSCNSPKPVEESMMSGWVPDNTRSVSL